MRLVRRILIVVAAMIAGGWTTGELAALFYVPYAGPPDCCLAPVMFTLIVLIPAGSLVSGLLALQFTGTSKKPIAAILVVLSFVFILWLLPDFILSLFPDV